MLKQWLANNEVVTINLAQKIVTMGLQTISLMDYAYGKEKYPTVKKRVRN